MFYTRWKRQRKNGCNPLEDATTSCKVFEICGYTQMMCSATYMPFTHTIIKVKFADFHAKAQTKTCE